jgi:hypothetical protein
MASNKKLRKVASQQAELTAEASDLTLREATLLGVKHDAKEPERPYVSLKYYSPSHQCLSEWSREKIQAFSQFSSKLNQTTWVEIYKTGGKSGSKVGFGYTVHKNHSVLPTNSDLEGISPDLTWFELRVGDESRVHGFRVKDAFFLVFLDQNHEVYSS